MTGILLAAALWLLLLGAGTPAGHIRFTLREPEGRTEAGVDLYRGSVEAVFRVSDPAYGIAEVTWILEAEGREILESGTAGFQDCGRAQDAGFEVLGQRGGNVLTAEKKIGIQRESQELMLRVGMKSWSGEEFWESQYLAVDGTAPELLLAADGTGEYRGETQHYLLTVRDRNFCPEDVTVQGNLPLPLQWQQRDGAFLAEFYLETEGSYAFAVSVSDRAGNQAEQTVGDSFVLDRTAPSIEISGPEGRPPEAHSSSLQITVRDQNLDRESVSVRLYGREQGEVSGWAEKQETADGSLCFQIREMPGKPRPDDVYSLQITCRDLAGNPAGASAAFTVNRGGSRYCPEEETKRLLGNYAAEAPEFAVVEENLDRLQEDSLKVWMTKNGEIRELERGREYAVSAEQTGKGYRYRYTVHPGVFDADGLYSFRFCSRDEAGNENDSSRCLGGQELILAVDRTEPLICCLTLNPEAGKEALFEIRDDQLLEKVQFRWDGKELPCRRNGERYTVLLPESGGKELEILAEDASGNQERLSLQVDSRQGLPLLKLVAVPGTGAAAGFLFSFIKKKKERGRVT